MTIILLGTTIKAQVSIITTIAGTGTAGYSGDGGAAVAATIAPTGGIAIDASGNIFLSDPTHFVVRKISTSGAISTVAGTGSVGYSSDGIAANTAALSYGLSIAVDVSGNLYIAEDTGVIVGRVRKVDVSTGIISTVAGGGTNLSDGVAATDAEILLLHSIAVDASGNIYICCDWDYTHSHKIKKIDVSTGIISTITPSVTRSDYTDETSAIVADGSGNCYYTSSFNFINSLSTSGINTRITGTWGYYALDPTNAAILAAGFYPYLFDWYGRLWSDYNGDYGDGGLAIDAGINDPRGIAIDGSGNIYFSDQNSVVRKINTSSIISTVAGVNTVPGYTGDCGEATAAEIGAAAKLAVDGSGDLYLADDATIRKVTQIIDAITGTTAVCGTGITSTLSNATSGGAWSSSDVTVVTVSTAGVVTSVSVGTAIISYSLAHTCGGSSITYAATVPFTVNTSAPSTPASIGGTTAICEGTFSWLTDATPSGTWSSSNPAIVYVATTGVVSGISGGSATITYTVSNGCGTANSTVSVTVTPILVAASISGTMIVCEGAATPLGDAVTGGTWSSSDVSVATVDPTLGDVTGIAAGTATITYTVSNSCGSNSTTADVTVEAAPDAGSIIGTTTVCVGAVETLSDGSAGGIWSSSDISFASVDPSTGDVIGVVAGSLTITYTVTNSCGSISTTTSETVNPLPVTGIITTCTPICKNDHCVWSSSVSGGTWSSTKPYLATVSTSGDVYALSASTSDSIVYTVTNSCGSVSAYHTVTVDDLPHHASGAGTLCVGSSITVVGAPSTGSWSPSGTSIATASSTGSSLIVYGLSPGSYSTTFTSAATSGFCAGSYADVVNVIAPPTALISGVSIVHLFGTTSLTGSGGTGVGTWATTGGSCITTSVSGTSCTVGCGSLGCTPVISYTVTNGVCTNTTSVTLTVSARGVNPDLPTGNTIGNDTENIKIYPNPSKGIFTIELLEANPNATIIVMDISGKVLETKITADIHTDFDLSNYAKGFYLINVDTGIKKYHKKITLE